MYSDVILRFLTRHILGRNSMTSLEKYAAKKRQALSTEIYINHFERLQKQYLERRLL